MTDNRMARFPVLLLWLLLAPLTAPHAITVDPFSGTAPVVDRSEAARRAALAAALGEALVKLTGTASAERLASERAAARIVRQFRYRAPEAGAESAGDPTKPSLELVVSFVPAGVRALAMEAGVPLWPLERAGTALWLAIEDGAGRRLLGTRPGDEALIDAFAGAAERRAVPVVLPLLDLEDQARVSAAAVWGGFADRLRGAAERYAVSQTLSGRIERDRDRWSGRWVLDAGERLERWVSVGDSPEALLVDLADDLAERLAARFAVRVAGGGGTALAVHGVAEASSLGAVVAYLSSLSVVEGLRLRQLGGATALFELEVAGGGEALARVLALGDSLVPEPLGSPNGGFPNRGFPNGGFPGGPGAGAAGERGDALSYRLGSLAARPAERGDGARPGKLDEGSP